VSDLRRPVGRLFLCAAILAATAAVYGASPVTTTVSDVIYRADGTPAKGTLLISWPAFISADSQAVSAGSLSVPIGPGGAINLALVPNE
jgi:trimeric autotransporter adhesin